MQLQLTIKFILIKKYNPHKKNLFFLKVDKHMNKQNLLKNKKLLFS